MPIYNGYLIYKCADVPLWNFVGLFIPILNIYCFVNIWGSIAERLGKSYWFYGMTILLFGSLFSFLPLTILILSVMLATNMISFEPSERFETVKNQRRLSEYIEAKRRNRIGTEYTRNIPKKRNYKCHIGAVQEATEAIKPLDEEKQYKMKRSIFFNGYEGTSSG